LNNSSSVMVVVVVVWRYLTRGFILTVNLP